MEEYLNPLALTHVLQYTLRSLCSQESNSRHQWLYAVFWRILPRNYPPPKLDTHGGAYDRSKSSNKRNWILVWEDGFCNFGTSSSTAEMMNSDDQYLNSLVNYSNGPNQGLQPETFFKMSHEIYNFGEGLIGKVAADRSHKWIYKEASDNQDINFLSAWHHSPEAQPRTWEAQFQSGIKTIALIALREGVVQLGSMHKVAKDLSYVVLLRKKFAYIESIPGVLLPHSSSSTAFHSSCRPTDVWPYRPMESGPMTQLIDHNGYDDQFNQAHHHHHHHQPLASPITPSMSSLEALLSKLPSVVAGPSISHHRPTMDPPKAIMGLPMGQRMEEEGNNYQQNFTYHYQDINIDSSWPSSGFL